MLLLSKSNFFHSFHGCPWRNRRGLCFVYTWNSIMTRTDISTHIWLWKSQIWITPGDNRGQEDYTIDVQLWRSWIWYLRKIPLINLHTRFQQQAPVLPLKCHFPVMFLLPLYIIYQSPKIKIRASKGTIPVSPSIKRWKKSAVFHPQWGCCL